MNEKFIYKHFFLKYFLITLNPKYFNNDVLEIENCCPRNQLSLSISLSSYGVLKSISNTNSEFQYNFFLTYKIDDKI